MTHDVARTHSKSNARFEQQTFGAKDQIRFWNYTCWILVEKLNFGRKRMVC